MFTEYYSIHANNRDDMNHVNERMAALYKAEARNLEITRERGVSSESLVFITITYDLDQPEKLPAMPKQEFYL